MSKHFNVCSTPTSYSLNIISSFISNIAFHIINLYLKVVLYQQVIISIFSKIQPKREFSPILNFPTICVCTLGSLNHGISLTISLNLKIIYPAKPSKEEYIIVCERISRK